MRAELNLRSGGSVVIEAAGINLFTMNAEDRHVFLTLIDAVEYCTNMAAAKEPEEAPLLAVDLSTGTVTVAKEPTADLPPDPTDDRDVDIIRAFVDALPEPTPMDDPEPVQNWGDFDAAAPKPEPPQKQTQKQAQQAKLPVRREAPPAPSVLLPNGGRTLQDACLEVVTARPSTDEGVLKALRGRGYVAESADVTAALGRLRSAGKIRKRDEDLRWVRAEAAVA